MTRGNRQASWLSTLAVALLGGATLFALAPRGAQASTVTLDGSGQMSFSFQFLWSNPGTTALGNDYVLSVPGQYTFLDQFLAQQPLTPNLASSPVDISNMQFRLYSVPSATTAPVVGGLPTGATLIQSWIGAPSGSNSIVATFAGIQTGSYILDIAGIASGTSGGTYVGQLDLVSSVPLPAAFWLFASALGLAGTRLRRPAA